MLTEMTEHKIKDNGIAPGPPQKFLFGNLFDARRQGTLQLYMDAWRQYGDITRFQMGPMTIHQVVRPEHIQHVLVKNRENYLKGFSHDKLRASIGYGILTSEGDYWQRQRRLMSPTYTPKAVQEFADIMLDVAVKMLAQWQTLPDGTELIINQEMMRLAMSVISRSMFSIDISEDFAEAGEALSFILVFTSKRSMGMIDPPLFIPTPMNRKIKWALQTIDSFLYRIIEQRRAMPPGDDLLSLLMGMQDEETGLHMDDQQLRDEVLITFFAGHETTAQLLTWTWYLLSRYPEVEQKLHQELKQVLDGRSPTLDDVPQLTYTRMILDEALRLYSPVAIMARDAQEDDEIGGYHIPAGSMVTITPYVTHRHPEFWEKPWSFYPEHFTPERVAARPRYAYYPFGAGPRICLGMHFALLEAVLVLAEVAQRYYLRPQGDMPDVGVKFAGTLRPDQPIRMTLHAR